MEIELISKKELLQLTNISYGQLYRWKRKNLIPEDWFIKKSVSTGQETFFPKQQILERIAKIIELKDQVSLDELSEIFSPKVEEPGIEGRELLTKKIVSEQAVLLYQSMSEGEIDLDNLKDILMVKILEDYVVTGQITFDEGKMLYQFLNQHFAQLNGDKACLILIRHLGLPFVIGTLDREQVLLDQMDKTILEIEVMKELGAIKFALLA